MSLGKKILFGVGGTVAVLAIIGAGSQPKASTPTNQPVVLSAHSIAAPSPSITPSPAPTQTPRIVVAPSPIPTPTQAIRATTVHTPVPTPIPTPTSGQNNLSNN